MTKTVKSAKFIIRTNLGSTWNEAGGYFAYRFDIFQIERKG